MKRPHIRRLLLHGGTTVGWISEGHKCWKHENEPPESRAFACPECGQSWRRWADGSWQEQPWLEPPYRRVEFLVGARSGVFNDEALFLGDVPDWPFKAVRVKQFMATVSTVGQYGQPSARDVPGNHYDCGYMGDQGETLCGEGMTFSTAAECLGLELTEFGMLLEPLPARMPKPTRFDPAANQSV